MIDRLVSVVPMKLAVSQIPATINLKGRDPSNNTCQFICSGKLRKSRSDILKRPHELALLISLWGLPWSSIEIDIPSCVEASLDPVQGLITIDAIQGFEQACTYCTCTATCEGKPLLPTLSNANIC